MTHKKAFNMASALRASFLAALLVIGTDAMGKGKGKSSRDDDKPAEIHPFRYEKSLTSKIVESASNEENKVKFPLEEEDVTFLRDKTDSVSVLLLDEGDICSIKDLDLEIKMGKILENFEDIDKPWTGGKLYPVTHPEDKKDFWQEFEYVVNVQKLRKTKQQNPCTADPLVSKKVMPQMTELWKGFDINDVAEAVNDEFPGIYHNQMIAAWVADKVHPLKFDENSIPKTGMADFLRTTVMLTDMIGYAVRVVGQCNFSLKWKEGRARPEEVAWKIYQNHPDVKSYRKQYEDLIKDIKKIYESEPKDATNFTAYEVGSPKHPSWPAMHSAASASAFWLSIVLDKKDKAYDDRICEARMLDYSVSYARTVAGVHYRDDNIAGLMIGQEILAETLPTYLELVYGDRKNENAVKEYVEGLISADREKDRDERVLFTDWANFETSDCYKEERFETVPAAKPLTCFDKRTIPGAASGETTGETSSSSADRRGDEL